MTIIQEVLHFQDQVVLLLLHHLIPHHFSFPQPDTSTAMSAVSPGMNLNPNKNYSVTVKSINNPSFGAAGSIDPLTHHTLEVRE